MHIISLTFISALIALILFNEFIYSHNILIIKYKNNGTVLFEVFYKTLLGDKKIKDFDFRAVSSALWNLDSIVYSYNIKKIYHFSNH